MNAGEGEDKRPYANQCYVFVPFAYKWPFYVFLFKVCLSCKSIKPAAHILTACLYKTPTLVCSSVFLVGMGVWRGPLECY